MFKARYAAAAIAVCAVVFAGLSAQAGSTKKHAKRSEDVVYVDIHKPLPERFRRRVVSLTTNENPGTIIIDSNNKFLYYVQDRGHALRYGIGVGREGFGWSGVVRVGRKAEWPGWTPPKEMIARERARGHNLPAHMDGGKDNPLGARALYLFGRAGDSGYRIHGTNQPWSIGLNLSSGCFRMMNNDVEDLYKRVPVGAKVIVIGPGNRQGKVVLEDKGTDFLRSIFASLGG